MNHDQYRSQRTEVQCAVTWCRACGAIQLRVGAMRMGMVLAANPALQSRLLDTLIRAACRRAAE